LIPESREESRRRRSNLNGKQELRHPRHRLRGERASHWLIPEFREESRRRSQRVRLQCTAWYLITMYRLA